MAPLSSARAPARDGAAAAGAARWVRRLRLGGLPLHPLTVHFPVALLTLAPAFDGLALAGIGGQAALWAAAASGSLLLGLAASLPAVASGLLELLGLAGTPDVTRTAVWHMVAMASAVTLDAFSALLRFAPLPLDGGPGHWLAAACSFAALGPLVWGGHQGARLVYFHGAGRTRLETESGASSPTPP